MEQKSKFWTYFKAYEWSNVYAMIKNNRKDPLQCATRFDKKLVVITGATSGIGRAAAKKYASMGAELLCINRNREKSEILKTEIEQDFDVKCSYVICDLSDLDQVHQLADKLLALTRPIDVIIHNAGVYLTRQLLTSEGIDKVFMVHYLAPFIINFRLKEKLIEQKSGRIILVGSEGHRFAAWGLRLDDLNWQKRKYSGLKSYGSAKLAQLLSMLVFADLFNTSGVTINTMHPGAVKTETGQENGPMYRWYKRNILDKTLRPVEIAADALYYLGVSKDVKNINGKFFNLTTIEEPTPPALDKELAETLFEISLKMGKICI